MVAPTPRSQGIPLRHVLQPTGPHVGKIRSLVELTGQREITQNPSFSAWAESVRDGHRFSQLHRRVDERPGRRRHRPGGSFQGGVHRERAGEDCCRRSRSRAAMLERKPRRLARISCRSRERGAATTIRIQVLDRSEAVDRARRDISGAAHQPAVIRSTSSRGTPTAMATTTVWRRSAMAPARTTCATWTSGSRAASDGWDWQGKPRVLSEAEVWKEVTRPR